MKPNPTKPAPSADSAAPEEVDLEAWRLAQTEMASRTRRSFLTAGLTLAASGLTLKSLDRGDPIGTLRRPLRAAEDLNAAIAQQIVGESSLAPTYSATRASKTLAAYGPVGIRRDLDLTSWRLQLTGIANPHLHPAYDANVRSWQYRYTRHDPENELQTASTGMASEAGPATPQQDPGENKLNAGTRKALGSASFLTAALRTSPVAVPGLLLTLPELQRFPFVEQTTEFKCIEGWSDFISFGGIRFSDFLEAYPPQRNPDGSLPRFAAMTTPEGTYFCGFEMAALLHPQTLLCFQMSGRDLTPAHGAPLRLAMPLKYGYKQIKQIARIHYTNSKPEDYWANLGYDWHGGL